ncbi:hypothetical protein [Alicyclobacillus acidocaldarius]|nr:hypothetical protein [Alicyclobacillus acidocaldarius]
MKEGLQEGIDRVVRNLLRQGVDLDLVREATGLSAGQLEALRRELD